jgi:transcriptional regulator with XRE-family HTH domain
MTKASETSIDKYNALFATTLRDFMMKSPKTSVPVTQKELAGYLGVRPQTVSLYCTGESLPNCEQLLHIADFFGVTADYMMTGRKPENKPVREMLGLSETAVQNMRLVNDGYFEDSPYMLPLLDCLLSDKGFYTTLERAAYWQQNGAEDEEELREFYAWKATQVLNDYFMDFLSKDLKAIYTERKRGD